MRKRNNIAFSRLPHFWQMQARMLPQIAIDVRVQ